MSSNGARCDQSCFGFVLGQALASKSQPSPLLPFPHLSHRYVLGAPAAPMDAQHHCSYSPASWNFLPLIWPCFPQPRAACPSWGFPLSHQLLMSIPQAQEGGQDCSPSPPGPSSCPSSWALASPPWLHFTVPQAHGCRNVIPVGTRGLCLSRDRAWGPSPASQAGAGESHS